MIDCHCHLEQKNYNKDRDSFIKKLKKKLKALITCCAHPQDFDLTLSLVKKYKNFVFCCIGIHPTYIKEITEQEIIETIKEIENNKESIVGIGETGLDFHWIKDHSSREKQKELFVRLIFLAKKLNKPLVIHSRKASKECIDILEMQGMKGKSVLMHMLQDRKQLQRVINNGWYISIGPGIKKSKDMRKIARDMPLNRILLETDSPWFAQGNQKRGTPVNVEIAAQKIAEIKKIKEKELEKQTDLNAIRFFNLPIK